jgi:CBS domain-containing protein
VETIDITKGSDKIWFGFWFMVLLVKDVMTKRVVRIEFSETVLEAARLMSRKRIGCLVVVELEKPVGIITERDVLRRVVAKGVNPAGVKVAEVMSKPLKTIGPNDSIDEAARRMIKDRIRRLPVVEGLRLVGIVTSTDLVKHWGERQGALSVLLPLGEAPEVSENQESCPYFKPDPCLPPRHVWKVCGACYWYLDYHCIRESSRLFKQLSHRRR